MMRLEELLGSFDQVLIAMAKKVLVMHDLAIEALKEDDKAKALIVVEMDDYVNHYNEEINNKAIEMLSLLQPVAKDLRSIIAGIRISIDLERIGDYAKGIARYTIKQEQLQDELFSLTHDIYTPLRELLEMVIELIETKDTDLAYRIPEQDEKLDAALQRAIASIEKLMETKGSHHYPFHYFGMLRNLERAGDHTKNIAESLIYQIKGQHVDFG